MKKIILFAVSFLCAVASPRAQQAGTQTITTDNVPIEEYVPKVIIEGKWGTGAGEFGKASRFPLGYFEQYVPSSLAVNSKGEIYILDYVNNRIQKFNGAGEFLRNIQVEGMKAELKGYCVGGTCYEEPPAAGLRYDRAVFGDVEVSGINIVIDSKDTLYYYLKRVKDGKETREVWEFRDDKVAKKYFSTQKGGLPQKFQLTPVGYNQFALAVAEPATTPKAHKYHVKVMKEGENSRILVEDNAKKIISRIEVPVTMEYSVAKAKHGRAKSDVYFEKMLDNGNFQVRTVNGGLENISTEEREYTPEGKLVRRVKSPPGNSHGIDVGENGVKVIRWAIQKGN